MDLLMIWISSINGFIWIIYNGYTPITCWKAPSIASYNFAWYSMRNPRQRSMQCQYRSPKKWFWTMRFELCHCVYINLSRQFEPKQMTLFPKQCGSLRGNMSLWSMACKCVISDWQPEVFWQSGKSAWGNAKFGTGRWQLLLSLALK